MDYSIKTGDLLAFEGNEIYSKIIQKWGGFQSWFWNHGWKEDKITHVGIAIWIVIPNDTIPDRLCILEAHMSKGIRLNPLNEVLLNQGGKAYHLPTKLDGPRVASEALKHWSKSYASLFQFVVAGLKTFQFMRLKFGKAVNTNSNRFHCSELVMRSLIDAGFTYDKDPAVTTPQQVVNLPCFGPATQLFPGPELPYT